MISVPMLKNAYHLHTVEVRYNMDDWKKGLILEMGELEVKLHNLKGFLKGEVHKGIDEIDKAHLRLQSFHMKGYLNVLADRVSKLVTK
jgi:hypothetical protein